MLSRLLVVSKTFTLRNYSKTWHGNGYEVSQLIKQGKVSDAMVLFNKSPDPGGASSLISVQTDPTKAMSIYNTLVEKDSSTAAVLRAIVRILSKHKQYSQVSQFIDDMKKNSLALDQFLASKLAYACYKQHDIPRAKILFSIAKQSKHIFNIVDCAQLAKVLASDESFVQVLEYMDANNILGDTVFYISALSVCNLENGILIHKHAEKKNFNSIEVTTALVSMYTKFKYFSPIQKLYDKDQLDPSNESGEIFYLTLLSACAKGKLVTLGNTVALSLKDKNLGARLYNALIYMHTQNLQLQEAQDIYHEMKKKRIACDSHSIVSLLTACADIGPAAMDFGKSIYNDVRVEHEFVLNSLINMFGKCGDPDEARRVFDQWRDSTTVSVVTWTALIGAYGNVGRIEEALETFNTMLSQGVTPNVNTIGVLLNACAHSGSINEAEQLIARLDTWNIKLNEYHRTCLVDVYARAGRLQEAEDLLANSPPNIISLTSLLGACRSTGDVERAERIFSKLIKLDSTQAHAYVLMANIYAKAGDTENRNKIWKLMHKNNVKKIPGISQVFVNNKLYSFKSEDVDHPQWREIYKYYDTLNDEMVEAGFEPDTSYVTRNDVLSEEDKKQVLCRHSEKIGIAFALMSTLEGTPIKVSKNLRVCGDCHTATKFIAKLKQRRIIVRDARRTHVFSKDGTCSCGDYW